MDDSQLLLYGLAGVVVLGVGAQWLAWRLALPSVVVLLAVGFLAGPVSGLLSPDRIFGELLFPFVSLSVALVLFEGGLSLKIAGLRETGPALWRLVSVGMVVTWCLSSLGAWLLFDMPPALTVLLGAILVVSGPTVIGPMLRHIRPVGRSGPVARWEGIVIDPIGATVAVLVLEAIGPGQTGLALHLSGETGAALVRTVLAGGGLGLAAAAVLVLLLKRYWIPDYLQSPVTVGFVAGCFAACNHLQHESGLLAVTVMGVILANQRFVVIQHIIRFKEDLTVLLTSVLFILLAARVETKALADLGWQSAVFVAWLILVVRPAAVFLSTMGTPLSWADRVFLAWLAPRGIVAAAVSSVFAFRLGPAAAGLVPATFVVIVGTVVVYGLTTPWLARRLGIAPANPQGVLIVGAYAGARAIAAAIHKHGFRVLLVDTNPANVSAARLEGLPSYLGSIVSEAAAEETDLGGIGRLFALTRNDEVNSLAVLHFGEIFGRREVYQLASRGRIGARSEGAAHLRGRSLFGDEITYDELERRFARGDVIKATPLTGEFGFEDWREQYGDEALPLFAVEDRRLIVYTADREKSPRPGQTLIGLVGERA